MEPEGHNNNTQPRKQCRRRQPNIKSTLGQFHVFAGEDSGQSA